MKARRGTGGPIQPKHAKSPTFKLCLEFGEGKRTEGKGWEAIAPSRVFLIPLLGVKGVTAEGERICGRKWPSGEVSGGVIRYGCQRWDKLSEGPWRRWPKWDSHHSPQDGQRWQSKAGIAGGGEGVVGDSSTRFDNDTLEQMQDMSGVVLEYVTVCAMNKD
ncbi:hypothetical protein Acr_00g0095010 [Actinidia rufa]|uniref:Uncharacterized protein n=1 Tax=Actinidia rufa TaxID=165716 RepID=A0A7J0DZC5_9ERIC|nr:hypothetical protein Acr_00g0095010 [Actinidia rufa]